MIGVELNVDVEEVSFRIRNSEMLLEMGEYKEAWASCSKANILVSDGQRKRHPNHQTDQKTDPWSNEQMKQTTDKPKENPTDKRKMRQTKMQWLDGQTVLF